MISQPRPQLVQAVPAAITENACGINGGRTRTRTCDPLIKSQFLLRRGKLHHIALDQKLSNKSTGYDWMALRGVAMYHADRIR
jgi:hypothetical protein